MTVPPILPRTNRWLLTLLALSLLIDTLASLDNGRGALGALPGAALMGVCGLLGAQKPAEGAIAGAFTLVGSTFLIRKLDTVPRSLGINDLLLTEMAAGVALVVFVVWRCKPLVSTFCTTMLVGATLFALHFRTGKWSSLSEFRSLQVGLLMLVVSVLIGVYLRGVSGRRTETELGNLVRRQWPLAAALAMMMFLDLQIGANSSRTHIFALFGALIASVCAFFAPRAPVSMTLVATTGVALSPFVLFVTGGVLPSSQSGAPVVLTEIAASMALIAFVIRWGPKWPAGLSTGALSLANVLALQLRALSAPDSGGDRLSSFGLYLVILLIVAVATGLYFRSRDRERTQSVRSAVTGAQQSERLALARELHDVVAHHVTGIVVQAQAARLVSDRDPQIAVQALAKIETSGVEALKAMRFLVASMRGAKPAGTSQATEQATTDLTADLKAVVENFSGPPVRLSLNVPDVVPQEVGRSVLRVVQESLTNVGKHALGARSVLVEVRTTSSELHVRVTDDGTGRRTDPVGGSGGYGLVGMRERVELLGGRFAAGPAEPVGWQVDAWLPIQEEDTVT
ncbi:signal transduction histidine kinase [Kibdelosporangium banguiense]|uniref:histidine kinase n=1 Tax=Kibdelosporangium banguiense TaxID=1365924 RepID=A0ABS4TB93_9PSEU|nr:histidine kinase [Kibdelosporangium banguiense]MBP2321672.1 signal transduction histidine kinase [Kibdelosporangium banguiense]